MNKDEALMQIISIRLKAEEIFNTLRTGLFHSLLIVCIKQDGKVNYHDSIDEPSSHYDFSNIFAIADALRNVSQSKFLVNTNPQIQESYEKAFAQSEFDSAIKKVVEQMDFYHEFSVFVSGNIIRTSENEKAYLVLKLNNKVYDDIYKLPVHSISRLRLYASIVESAVYTFFEEVSKAEDHDSDGFAVPQINQNLVIKTAGTSFMCTPTSNLRNGDGMFGLAEKINKIASLEYEKQQIKQGGIILTFKDNPIITYNIKFKNPVFLSNAKRIRKLLEITTKEMKLVSDGSVVFGLGAITTDFNSQKGDVYEIRFNKQYSWTLLHAEREVLEYYMETPSLPRNIISIESFDEQFFRIFGKTDDNKIKSNSLYNIIFNIIEEHCGTILVISENAIDEAERLKGQSTLIEPMKLDPNNVKGIIKIDGATLINTDGICYAIGVILDGMAVQDKGDPSRGSRYNSSIRYYYSQKNKCKLMVVIISDDGDVNIMPELPPQISKKIIQDIIGNVKQKVEIVQKGGTIDTGDFNKLVSLVQELSMYFTKDECDLLNTSFAQLENNCEPKDVCRIMYSNIIPNNDFEAKLYFKDE